MTQLTLKVDNNTFAWNNSNNDCNINDILEAFNGLLIGITFTPETITRGMYEFALEHNPDLINE